MVSRWRASGFTLNRKGTLFSSHTTTDAQGQYEFKNLLSGYLQLLARNAGYAQSEQGLLLTQEVHRADFVLVPESILTAWVVDVNERPLEGVVFQTEFVAGVFLL